MSLPSLSEKRGGRPDTKTLVRLGLDLVEDTRGSEPPVSEPPPSEPPPSEPPPDQGLVQLSFQGVRDPVRVRATREAAGLQLTAALPFLELDSLVGIAAPEAGAPQQGRIRRVRLEHSAGSKVPQLSVELAFSDAPSVDAELPVDEAALQPAAPAPAPAVERRTRPSLVLGFGLVLGAVFGAAVALESMSTLRGEEVRGAFPVARLAAQPPPRLAAIAAAPPPAASAPAPVPADDAVPDLATITAEALANDANDADDADDSATPPSSAPRGDAAPQVTVDTDATHVLVPLRGDATDLRTYELSTPGLAVTLPHAQALGPIGNQRIVAGLVRRVWLLPEGPEGVQVRIITRRPPTRSSATFDEAGLHITLAH